MIKELFHIPQHNSGTRETTAGREHEAQPPQEFSSKIQTPPTATEQSTDSQPELSSRT